MTTKVLTALKVPISILCLFGTGLAAYLFLYASVINWAMVAVGTSYAILMEGRVLGFQQAQSVRPELKGSASTLDELNAVFHTAAIKASRPKHPTRAVIEKIPKPAIRPIMPFVPTSAGGVTSSSPSASLRLMRKPEVDDPASPKKPLGQTSPRKTPQKTGAQQ